MLHMHFPRYSSQSLGVAVPPLKGLVSAFLWVFKESSLGQDCLRSLLMPWDLFLYPIYLPFKSIGIYLHTPIGEGIHGIQMLPLIPLCGPDQPWIYGSIIPPRIQSIYQIHRILPTLRVCPLRLKVPWKENEYGDGICWNGLPAGWHLTRYVHRRWEDELSNKCRC